MTAEQCVRIERLARATAASQALEALIGEKVVDLTASRRCPHCGAVGVVKHGLDDNGQQRFRCRPPLGCGRTFNALTGTPLARMRKPEIWLAYYYSCTFHFRCMWEYTTPSHGLPIGAFFRGESARNTYRRNEDYSITKGNSTVVLAQRSQATVSAHAYETQA